METKMTKEEWNKKEIRQHKSMCLAYAKDLAVADKIKVEDITAYAKQMVMFIWGVSK